MLGIRSTPPSPPRAAADACLARLVELRAGKVRLSMIRFRESARGTSSSSQLHSVAGSYWHGPALSRNAENKADGELTNITKRSRLRPVDTSVTSAPTPLKKLAQKKPKYEYYTKHKIMTYVSITCGR